MQFTNYTHDFVIADFDKHDIVFTAITNAVNSDGSRVIPSAFRKDLHHYKRNPIVLWNHNKDLPAVGKMVEYDFPQDAFLVKVRFAVKTELGRLLWDLYSEGYMNAISVGFIPIESTDIFKQQGQTGKTYTRCQLTELSLVPQGANPNALTLIEKIVKESPLRTLFEQVEPKKDIQKDDNPLDKYSWFNPYRRK